LGDKNGKYKDNFRSNRVDGEWIYAKRELSFQDTTYKFESDLNIENKLIYMDFKHKAGDSLSIITFFFYPNGKLEWINLRYFNIKSRNRKSRNPDYCIYDHKWEYEQKRDAYYDFGKM
jgi:hypothetical protein